MQALLGAYGPTENLFLPHYSRTNVRKSWHQYKQKCLSYCTTANKLSNGNLSLFLSKHCYIIVQTLTQAAFIDIVFPKKYRCGKRDKKVLRLFSRGGKNGQYDTP